MPILICKKKGKEGDNEEAGEDNVEKEEEEEGKEKLPENNFLIVVNHFYK